MRFPSGNITLLRAVNSFLTRLKGCGFFEELESYKSLSYQILALKEKSEIYKNKY